MSWLILLILLFEVIFITVAEYKFYSSWFTPVNLLSIPYCIVVFMAFFFAPTLGFIPLYTESILVWIIGLFIFWQGSLLVKLATGTRIAEGLIKAKLNGFDSKENTPVVLALLAASINIYGLTSMINREGLLYISTEEFQRDFSEGLQGWTRAFSIFLVSYLIGTTQRTKLIINITIMISLLLLVINQVKGIIIIPILAGIIYRAITGTFRIRGKSIFFTVAAFFLIFMMVYLISYVGLENSTEVLTDLNVYEALSRHFISYLFSGVLSFGDAFKNGLTVPDEQQTVIIAPIYNGLRHLFGWTRVDNLTSYYSVIDLTKIDISQGSNVHTLIGTVYLFLGGYFAIAYLLLLSLTIYILFWMSSTFNNKWITIIFTFFVSGLPLGWFELYYWHAFFVQGVIFGAVMLILDRLLNARNKDITDKQKIPV